MGVAKAMAPVALGLLVAVLLVGTAGTSLLAGCAGPQRMELQEHEVWVRYLLVRIAPVAAGIFFWAGMADDDLTATAWELRVLCVVGLNLSFASSLLALAALTTEFSCDCVVHWLAMIVALVAAHLVAVWAARGRLRALNLRRAI
ncbi:hypothetical protein VPH35_067981 [Triticum aestivum]